MKKIFVAFLTLAVAGGWLVAQDAPTFTWGGEFITGAHVVVKEALDDPLLTLANDDGNNRVRLNGTVDGTTYGFKFRLQASNVAVADTRAVTIPWAFGWVTGFNGLLKVTAGQIDGKVWNTPGKVDAGWDADAAVRFEFKPLDGLNVGFALKPDGLVNPKDLAGGYAIADVLQETVIGVSYTGISNLTIRGSLKLDGDGDEAKDMNAGFGINYTGIPNLTTAALDFAGLYLGDLEDDGDGEIRIGQKVTYAAGALTLQLAAREYIFTRKDTDIGIWIEPEVSYKINDSWKGTFYAGIGSGDVFEHLGFEIKPSLTYTQGKATVDFIYKFNSHDTRPDLYKVAADGSTLQAIGVNFKWQF
ncbi:MAG: hypothetical protein LBP43_02980 [Treponema sp.]|jgi:hypothetical protein|nr:hypothetical protein [Treponema sp.]